MATYNPIFDLDHDGCVTQADVAIFQAHYGARRGGPLYDPAMDFNGDGVINVFDQSLLAQHVGTCAQASSITAQAHPLLSAAIGFAAGVLLYGLYAGRPRT